MWEWRYSTCHLWSNTIPWYGLLWLVNGQTGMQKEKRRWGGGQICLPGPKEACISEMVDGEMFHYGIGELKWLQSLKLSAALGLAELCRKVMGRQGPTPVRAVTKVRYCACGYHNWTRLEWGPWDIMFGPFWWPEESIYFLASLPCYPSQALLNYTSLWRVAFHFCMRLQKS